jgi:uncharacterized metal-binding protein YceD (DUF177 family)
MFCIQFLGLSLGHYKFDFHVDDAFFVGALHATPLQDEISSCDVNIDVNLEKTERFLKLDFHFSGEYSVPCDRCLDPVKVPIDHDEMLIVNFGNENDFDSEIWVVSQKEHELNLDTFIYETLVLLRPFSVMHDIQDCNPEMIKQLQNTPPPEQTEIDPRWEALKSLKNK